MLLPSLLRATGTVTLIAVEPAEEAAFLALASELGLTLAPIGELVERQRLAVEVF